MIFFIESRRKSIEFAELFQFNVQNIEALEQRWRIFR